MLGDPSVSARYLKSRLCGYPYEVFACLFLDNRHRVIAFEELFRGSIDGASVFSASMTAAAQLFTATVRMPLTPS